MYIKKFTTGLPAVDRTFDDLIAYINRSISSTGSVSSISTFPITPEGGFYKIGINGMGYKLKKGYLVKISISTNNEFVICNENEWDVFGAVYEDSNPGASCKVVFSGPCYVYFNSNGVTRGDFFRISKTDDTVNNDTGKAQGLSTKPDALWLKGFAHYSLVGEGLALCSILR